jgi:uncharacterized protein (DUF2141 family)
MKTVLTLILVASMQLVGNPNQIQKEKIQENGNLTINLKNVNVKNGGTIYLVMYDKQENFMTPNKYKSAMVNVADEKFEILFEDIPFGTYAVSSYHDINDNQRMDFSENGMPKEDYAMSGEMNPMGPPSWNDVKFQFEKDGQEVDLNF